MTTSLLGTEHVQQPAHVTIREVLLRDGLQLEAPISLADKLKLLDAIAATGVREDEATAFVSPTTMPALADAAELAAQLLDEETEKFTNSRETILTFL